MTEKTAVTFPGLDALKDDIERTGSRERRGSARDREKLRDLVMTVKNIGEYKSQKKKKKTFGTMFLIKLNNQFFFMGKKELLRSKQTDLNHTFKTVLND